MRSRPAKLPLPDMGLATISTPPSTMSTGFSSRLELTRAKITSADYVIVLRTVGNRLTGYLETQLDQTDATDTISGTMSAITTNRTLNATIDPAVFTTRLTAAKPAVTGLSLNYSIAAAPGADAGQTRGIQLIAGGSNPMTDTAVTVSYGNPFEGHGWKSVVTYSAHRCGRQVHDGACFARGDNADDQRSGTNDGDHVAGRPADDGQGERHRARHRRHGLPLDLTKPVAIAATTRQAERDVLLGRASPRSPSPA